MKNGSNKKKLIITGLIMFLLLTAFWSWNMPKLINADKPFIDLSGSIGESIGNAKTAHDKATQINNPEPTDIPQITDIPEPTDTPPEPPEKVEVRIVIGDDDMAGSGEKITANGNVIVSPEELSAFLDNDTDKEKEFIVVDNYAEAKTYRSVIDFLKNNETDYSTERTEAEE